MTNLPLRTRLGVDVGEVLPSERLSVSVEIITPRGVAGPPRAALFCVPGGGMTREFFDLKNGVDASFSFAEAMVARGFIVVLLNWLGVGGSSKPNDGFDLTPEVLADANAKAVEAILERIREGRLAFGVPAAPDVVAVGVGHSMGAKLSIEQQARHGQYDGLVLLGFGPVGLMDVLIDDAKAVAHKPDRIRAELKTLARKMFEVPYKTFEPGPRRAMFQSDQAEPAGMQALKSTRAPTLSVAGLFSMIPGSTAPQAATIEAPILVVSGDLDFISPVVGLDAYFPRAKTVTLYVPPRTGHNLFVFAARGEIFRRIGDWVDAAAATA